MIGRDACARMRAVQDPVIPIVGELVRDNPGTISLGQGVVYYPPPDAVYEGIAEFRTDDKNHVYKLVQGIPGLLEAVRAKLSTDNGIEVEPLNQLVVTAGGNMAFMAAILAIADPGDEIILPTPCYFNHEMAITMASCIPRLVPTDEVFQPRPADIGNAITGKTRAIVTVSPNNPSGAIYPEPVLREINALCRDRGIYHISDEAYEYFAYDDHTVFSPGSIAGAGDYTISLYSLSKAYGMASWRMGYMVIPEHLLNAVKKIQDTILICPPVISQHAAVMAMAIGRPYCLEKRAEIEAVRRVLLAQLGRMGHGITVGPADGAFYVLLKIDTNLDAMSVVRALIENHGVAVIPGTAFGLDNGCYLRIAYGALRRATAEEGIGRLVKGLGSIVG